MAMYNVVAGSHFYIGGVIADQAADFIQGDFSSQTWIEVDGWQQMGDLGESPNTITTSLINRNRDKAMKGTRQAQAHDMRFTVIDADPGQLACIAAEASDSDYAFRMVFESGAERLFTGIVTSATETGGEANTIRFLAVNIIRNSNLVRVAAP